MQMTSLICGHNVGLCLPAASNKRTYIGADPGFRRRGFVQEFRLENRSYPDVHDFSLRMQVIIANYRPKNSGIYSSSVNGS